MWFAIISLFPDMFASLAAGVTGRAIKEGLITLHYVNPRDFTDDKHQSVDDKPYGGGAGMVMMAPPLERAILAAKHAAALAGKQAKVIYLSPQGHLFTQEVAKSMVNEQQAIILIAGRYEGIDQRLIDQYVDAEWSIGDYILTGGELAAMVMIDVMARLIPGTVGDTQSVLEDSLSQGLLKYPQFTRPEIFNGQAVPPVLLSGHHERIKKWREQQGLGQTWLKRKSLLEKKNLSNQEVNLLETFIAEYTPKTVTS